MIATNVRLNIKGKEVGLIRDGMCKATTEKWAYNTHKA